MPEIKELREHFRNNPNFAFLTVSLDGLDSKARLLETIDEHDIDYPVLHVGGEDGWSDGNFGWEISGVPSAYIIDPQGNIFADVYPMRELIEAYDWLAAQEHALPPVALSADHEVLDDGSVKVSVLVSNPTHEPIDISVSAMRMVREYNPDYDHEGTGEPNTYGYYDIFENGHSMDFTALFGEFGEIRQEFIIPAQEDATYISFSVDAVYPGSEVIGDGQGINISASGFINVEQSAE